jgi:hypothetical protein
MRKCEFRMRQRQADVPTDRMTHRMTEGRTDGEIFGSDFDRRSYGMRIGPEKLRHSHIYIYIYI